MSEERITELIQHHLARYPEIGIADVYKLLHQATFGPGHLIASKKKAREWLEEESGQVQPSMRQALVENIHPDGAIVRLHLRPYLAYKQNVGPLLDAFVRSAEQVAGDPETMALRWQAFVDFCKGTPACGGERLPLREVRLFGRIRTQEHWPAVHHSPCYHNAYHPVYRVVTRSEAEALCDVLGAPFEVV